MAWPLGEKNRYYSTSSWKSRGKDKYIEKGLQIIREGLSITKRNKNLSDNVEDRKQSTKIIYI